MSKVLVDRERVVEAMCLTWRHDFGLVKLEGFEFCSGMTDRERDHLRNQMGKLFDHHFAPALSAVTAERDRLDAECGRLLEGKIQDAETIYTLEAERDQLRAEVETMRVALLDIASVNPAERGIEWAKSYASDGLKGAGSELYARWLDAFKEAEALRSLLSKSLPIVEAHAGASHMLEGFRPTRNKWDELVDGIRAAMAAKEA